MSEKEVVRDILKYVALIIGVIFAAWVLVSLGAIWAGWVYLLEPSVSQSILNLSPLIIPLITFAAGFVAGSRKRVEKEKMRENIDQ